jgi:putative endonuclease
MHRRGRAGEALAVAYLEVLGWTIQGRNLRVGGIEVDVLAQEGETWVIVEVKYRGRSDYGGAALAFGHEQRDRLRRAARALGQSSGASDLRIDMIAIEATADGVCLRHFRSAVES